MLDTDASADVGESQVVVEDVPVNREHDDEPADETAEEDEEPTETDRAQVSESRPGDG
jgi:hypothetical protein